MTYGYGRNRSEYPELQDSLNNLAYYDDTQIVDCQCRKFYSENPRVEVTIINLSKEE